MQILNMVMLFITYYLYLMTNTITLLLTFDGHSTAEGYITYLTMRTCNRQ